MATLWRALVCLRVITDRQTNTATYVDSVELLNVPRFPHPLPPVVVASVWRRDSEQDILRARIRVEGPNGEEVFAREIPETTLSTEIHRYNLGIGGFDVTEPGVYRVLIEQPSGSHWSPVGQLPIRVRLLEAEAPVIRHVEASASTATRPPGKRSKTKKKNASRG